VVECEIQRNSCLTPKSRPLGTAPLVGRDDELGLLSGIWLQVVREARPHLVTVLGDPGLGKSRLVAEFEKRFCADARVLHGRCLPYGEALGYWALATALKEAAGITPDLEVPGARNRLDQLARAVLTNLSPADADGTARHLARLCGLETAEERSNNPTDQRTLHVSVRRFFEALAQQKPLCWMIEDIHWTDDALLDLIDLVAGRAKDVPLLILTQARPALLEKRPNWGAGPRGFTSLALETLKAQDARELVLALCRERGLAEGVADQVGQGAGGNPLFAEELVAVLAERGGQAGVPSAIKALIAARLDALPDPERHTLQLAAVFGKVFWLGGLAALDPDARVTEHLHRLEAKDLLRSQPRSQFRDEAEFVFKHDLIRDVAYDMLPRAERRQLHGRIADWIERAAGAALDSYWDQLAHHAVRAGQEDRAVGFLTDAAERAREVAAHRQEAALLGQAIAIAEKLGRLELAGELRARRGIAFERVGLWAQARAELERALEQLPAGALARRAQVLLTLAGVCFWDLDIASLRRFVSEATPLAQRLDRPDLIAEAEGWFGASKQAEGDMLGAVEIFRHGAAVTGARVAPRSVFALSLYLLGRTSEASEVARELVGRLRGQADTVSTMYAYPHLGMALAAQGRYAEATQVFEEARRFGLEYQVNNFLARAVAMSSGFHLELYDLQGHESINKEASETALRHNFAPTVVSAGIDLMLNYARRHEVSRAEELIGRSERAITEVGGWHSWLWGIRLAQARAELAFARGDYPESIRWADDGLARSRAVGRLKYEVLGLWVRARALDALGRRQEAIVELRAGLEKARALGDPAMRVRLAAALLALNGDDELAAETAATVEQIVAALPDPTVRQRFEEAEPVCLVRRLAPAAVANS
jgi:tetratricopeptide (TPR) repeat protein